MSDAPAPTPTETAYGVGRLLAESQKRLEHPFGAGIPDPTIPEPTAEDLLAEGPTAEELLADPKGAVVGNRNWLALIPGLNLLAAEDAPTFARGFMKGAQPEQGFGLSAEDRQQIEKDWGLGPYLQGAESGVGQTLQMFGRSMLYGSTALADLSTRVPGGIMYGVGDVLIEKGVSRDIVSMATEAFPGGPMTGLPTSPFTIRGHVRSMTRRVPERAIVDLDKAAAAGVFPDIDPIAVLEENVKNGTVEPPRPRDIQEAARAAAPEAMARYEADVVRSDFIADRLTQLNESLQNDPEIKANVERLRAEGRADEAENLLRDIRVEMTDLSAEQLAIARRMDEHFPQVIEAYKKGGDELAVERAPVERAPDGTPVLPEAEPKPGDPAVSPTTPAPISPEALRSTRYQGEQEYIMSKEAILEPDPYNDFPDALTTVPPDKQDAWFIHGTDTDANILDLLTNGIDPTREFHMGPPTPGSYGVDTTRIQGNPYLVLQEKGRNIKDTGVENVILQGPAAANKAALESKFPSVNFMTSEEAAKFMRGEGAPAKVVPDAVAPPKAPPPPEVINARTLGTEVRGETTPAKAVAAANKVLVDRVQKALAEGKAVTVRVAGEEVPVDRVEGGRLVPEKGRKLSATDVLTGDNEVLIFEQRAQSIARDTAGRVERAGRPPEEAAAAGRLVQAYYQTLAERFEGKLGTADQIYQKMAPRVVEGAVRSERVQGRTLAPPNARATIELMKNADPSTYPHELAHNWLEDMKRLVNHPEAPLSYKADWAAVQKGYGFVEGGTPKQYTAFQEKFARGFERYLMEGRAPSKALDTVFRKFADWLKEIYGAVSGVPGGRPLDAEMRGVYGRMLAAKERETLIAPDRVTMAEAHEATSATAQLSEAHGAANTMAGERAALAASPDLPLEVDYGRRDARRGPEGEGVLRGVPEEAGAEAGGVGEGAAAPSLDSGRTAPKAASGQGDVQPGSREGTRIFVDSKGNALPENILDEGDVALAVRQGAEGDGPKVPLSDEMLLNLGREFGLPAYQLDGKVIGGLWTREQVLSSIRLAQAQAERVGQAADKVDSLAGNKSWSAKMGSIDNPEVIQAIADYALEKERFKLITDTIVNTASDMGRAFHALRYAKHLKTLDEALEFFQRTVGKSPEELAREASLAKRTTDMLEMTKLIQQKEGPAGKVWRGVMEGFVSGLFSGTGTILLNLTGNLGQLFINIPETMVARGISITRRRGPTEGVTAGEISDLFHGLVPGAIKGAIGAGRALVDEGYAFRDQTIRSLPQINPRQPGQHGDIPNFRLKFPFMEWDIPIPLGTVLRYPSFRFLASGDELFQGLAESPMMHRLAHRMARIEIMEQGGAWDDPAIKARQAAIIINPPDNLIAAVKQHVRYQTFTNEMGDWGKTLQQAVRVHPSMAFIFPVVKSAINLFKAGIRDRTALGLASNDLRQDLFGHRGADRQDTAWARMAIGNTLLVATGLAFFQEFITDGGPTDAGEKETLRNTGWAPYSIVTRWGSFSYEGIQPLGSIMKLAADGAALGKMWFEADDKDVDKDEADKFMTDFGVRIAVIMQRNLFDQLALRGVSNMLEAIYSPEQNAAQYAQSFVTSFIPNLFGQAAAIGDPLMRETRNLLDAAKAKLPGLRNELVPKYDRWGQPVPRRAVGQFKWGPPPSNDPVNLAMARLEMNNAQPQREIDGVRLTDQQYADYVQISGQLAKQMLDQVVVPGFENMPKEHQRKLIGKTIEKSRAYARKAIKTRSLGMGEQDIVNRAYQNELRALKP